MRCAGLRPGGTAAVVLGLRLVRVASESMAPGRVQTRVHKPLPAAGVPRQPPTQDAADACCQCAFDAAGECDGSRHSQDGNSQGVLIPKPILAQLGLEGSADLQVREGVIEIRPVRRNPREGWDQDAQRLASEGGSPLVGPELASMDDGEWVW